MKICHLKQTLKQHNKDLLNKKYSIYPKEAPHKEEKKEKKDKYKNSTFTPNHITLK